MGKLWRFAAWPLLWLVVVPLSLILFLSTGTPTIAAQDDCTYDQYRNTAGECVCPDGMHFDRGPVWCAQTECPTNGGYNSVKECICNEGFSPEWITYETETGHVYELMTACVVPTAAESSSNTDDDSLGLADYFFPTRSRISDAMDSIRNGGAIERVAGVVSIGTAFATGAAIVYASGYAVYAGGTWVLGRVAQAGLRRAAIAAAERLAIGAEAAEVATITEETALAMRALIAAMKRAGLSVTPQNILNLINQARNTQGLHAWGMANIEIILKGIGLI